MDNNEPIMPLCLRKKAALDELTEAINAISCKYKLTFSVLNDLFFRIQANISEGCAQELLDAQTAYNRLLSERENNKKNEEVIE